MSCRGPDVAPSSSPIAGERKKPYQWCLRGIHINFQEGGLTRGASEDDSGGCGPGVLTRWSFMAKPSPASRRSSLLRPFQKMVYPSPISVTLLLLERRVSLRAAMSTL